MGGGGATSEHPRGEVSGKEAEEGESKISEKAEGRKNRHREACRR